ncbi:glycosyl transferase-like sugar-binding protein [Ancylobacter aquaticus]|uniref:Glycosyl transferase-like sugar-binding protein n=1 Tax=Ancylobacter aquaticus TaxID=100 RepID=A0A4R1IBS4_ANCAQ|nr:glycosyltransferase [Ancylobacter aquaticus]TCK27922.1 glycosyl transferase-like sugar-binding protein [Ancylobacter aquaticus]
MPQEDDQIIPKIIHTCWFGGGRKSAKMLKLERLRKQTLHDYEHVEWNEKNIEFARFPFLAKCHQSRHFAHLSDMVRLIKLFEIGGIYLDTDVEVVRTFTPLLSNEMFLGYMWDCNLGTAIIGARAGHPIIEGLLETYVVRPDEISTDVPNNDMMTAAFIATVEGFRLDGRAWRGKNVAVYDKTTFEHPSFLWRRNYTVHHFSASWRQERRAKAVIKGLIAQMPLGLYLYRKYICAKSIGLSPFKDLYKEARASAPRPVPPPQEAGGRPSR